MNLDLSEDEQRKQEHYRDARFTDKYDDIWQSVGKCVFCDLKDKYIFFEENDVVMTISLFAYIDGHFMIMPRRHVRSTKDLSQLEWQTIRKFTYMAKKLIKEVHGIKGMQFVQKDGVNAQSTVSDHIHFHCIPFDSPDLCQWNYRRLTRTPLENAELYKHARKKLVSYDQKYEQKYTNHVQLPVVCDLLMINTRQEILFQHRIKAAQLYPNYVTLPGGHIDDLARGLEPELAREVYEETGIDLDPTSFTLLHSQLGEIHYLKHVSHLKVKYPSKHGFIWNTYYLQNIDPAIQLKPGSDCYELEWIPRDSLEKRSDMSPQILELVRRLP